MHIYGVWFFSSFICRLFCYVFNIRAISKGKWNYHAKKWYFFLHTASGVGGEINMQLPIICWVWLKKLSKNEFHLVALNSFLLSFLNKLGRERFIYTLCWSFIKLSLNSLGATQTMEWPHKALSHFISKPVCIWVQIESICLFPLNILLHMALKASRFMSNILPRLVEEFFPQARER